MRFNILIFAVSVLEVYTNDVQVYKFLSNEYRPFPVFTSDNACDLVKQNKYGTSVTSYDTNITLCPLKKGFYYLHNAYLDDTKLPPYVPRGRFMIDIKVFYNQTIQLGHSKWYGAIVPTNPLEKCIACNI